MIVDLAHNIMRNWEVASNKRNIWANASSPHLPRVVFEREWGGEPIFGSLWCQFLLATLKVEWNWHANIWCIDYHQLLCSVPSLEKLLKLYISVISFSQLQDPLIQPMLTPGVLENDPLVEGYGRLTMELNLRVQVKCMRLLKVAGNLVFSKSTNLESKLIEFLVFKNF